jgi:hypothetical protein
VIFCLILTLSGKKLQKKKIGWIYIDDMGVGMRPFSAMQIVIIWIINNVFEYILCITDGISWMEVVYIYSTTSMSLFYVH